MDPIKYGFNKFLPVKIEDIAQPDGSIVEARLNVDSQSYPFSIDYSDYFPISEEQAAKSLLYFKMQCHKQGYQCENVLPGGFVTNDRLAYYLMEKLRLEQNKKFEVYGRFSLSFAQDIRRHAQEKLNSDTRFEYEGDLATISYGNYLRECASARACIDLPGNGAICFRLIDYLCLGSAIVSVASSAVFPVPLEHEEHLLYCKPDLSDLADCCFAILEDEVLERNLRKIRRIILMRIYTENS